MSNKAAALREILTSSSLEFMMEAHNALSAQLVQEIGFKSIWASGLSISAALGVRDCNEASWTQVLDVIEFMSDATSVPILLDGDTGYGNFNNLQRLVRKLEQRQVAGVCIEDKMFPKTNSFINGEKQPLASIEEFAGKIKAGKDCQSDSSFSIIARVEALIAGWGLSEALRRAEAYRQAGADAILIHSKRSDALEIELFMKEWANRHPVIVVPTKYYSTPTDRFRQLGISLVIWANHCLRASINAIREIAVQIHRDQSVMNVEHRIAPVSEVFRIQRAHELDEAEKVYLPAKKSDVTAIVLAGNPGRIMGALTANKPKCMIQVKGVPILHQLIRQLNELEIKDIVVVRGYCKESIVPVNFRTIDNDEYADSKGLHSLYLARDDIKGDTLICYGDSLFRSYLIEKVCAMPGDYNVLVDADLQAEPRIRDLVLCSKPYGNEFVDNEVTLEKIYIDTRVDGAHGQWIGLLFVRERGVGLFKSLLEELHARPDFRTLHLADLIAALQQRTRVEVAYTKGGWIDVDIYQDLEAAGNF